MLNYLLILTECSGQTVIEYALIFGLGFMAAALLVMLVAPAVHQRIVAYTENRLKATARRKSAPRRTWCALSTPPRMPAPCMN